MFGLLVQWLLYAIALLVVSKIVPGFEVHGLWPAMIAALVIGLLNATLGFFLKIISDLEFCLVHTKIGEGFEKS